METEELYDKLLKYCYMKVKDYHVAQDITQESFLRFLSNHKYKDMGKDLAYLYTVARNLCNDHFRKKKTVQLDENIVDETKYYQPSYIDEALDKLEIDEKEILVLRYTNDLSINDIAKYYEVSRFVVNRRIKKALKHLREVYIDER